jgi:hypothetical protein
VPSIRTPMVNALQAAERQSRSDDRSCQGRGARRRCRLMAACDPRLRRSRRPTIAFTGGPIGVAPRSSAVPILGPRVQPVAPAVPRSSPGRRSTRRREDDGAGSLTSAESVRSVGRDRSPLLGRRHPPGRGLRSRSDEDDPPPRRTLERDARAVRGDARLVRRADVPGAPDASRAWQRPREREAVVGGRR